MVVSPKDDTSRDERELLCLAGMVKFFHQFQNVTGCIAKVRGVLQKYSVRILYIDVLFARDKNSFPFPRHCEPSIPLKLICRSRDQRDQSTFVPSTIQCLGKCLPVNVRDS